MKPKLTLAMIALNEAHDLPLCVESARGLADEIVVIDSFSTDATVQIAKELGVTDLGKDKPSYREMLCSPRLKNPAAVY
jgi:glycosyltransferase involved in cell wall biosynthesis